MPQYLGRTGKGSDPLVARSSSDGTVTPIYLDHNATTPVDAQVLETMLPFLRGEFGNPSSADALGRRAHAAVERARAEVAHLIGAAPEEVVFTGGATEATNLAIRGPATSRAGRSIVVTTNVEHPATEACCNLLQRWGHAVRRVSAKSSGIVPAEHMAAMIDDRTALVTVIHAQNEIGTLQPVREIARAARARDALMHTDAAQSVGKIPVDVNELEVDLLTIAGHKLYAPKGIGALYVRRGVELSPVVVGAGQEHGLRPGTENVAFIVGLGAACAVAARTLEVSRKRMAELSAQLLTRLLVEVPGLALVGDPVRRLPNTLKVLFPDASGRRVLEACPGVLASTGSACHADSEEPSAILTALGIPRDRALGAVRLSLGRATTREDVELAASELAAAWRRLRTTVEVAH
jgi:cysteine desulfurase